MANIINGDNGVVSGTAGLKSSSDGTGILALQTNGTTAVTVDASQNVGIGTVSPASKLEVAGLTNITAGGIKVTGSPTGYTNEVSLGGATADSSYAISTTGTGTPGMFFDHRGTSNTGAFYFRVGTTATTERMRIDSSGNLRVGTTTNAALGGERVSVEGGPLGVKTTTAECMGLWSNRATGTYIAFYSTSSGTNTGNITTNGTTTTYATSSDYRLKNTVTPMTGALAKVVALKPVTYKWNSDGSTGEGFLAHELQAIVPDCVTGEKDGVEIYTDENGKEQTKPKYQGIDTSFLVATLTAAIQEQQAIITAQQATLASLTARITALETP